MLTEENVTTDRTNSSNGFSARFNKMLDRLNIPSTKRYTFLANLLNVSVNAVRGWCQGDKSPRKIEDLNLIVKTLINTFSSESNSNSNYSRVVAWLLVGDEIDCQFNSTKHDELLTADIYNLIFNLSLKNKINFSSLDPEKRKKIYSTALNLASSYGSDPLKHEGFEELIKGMLIIVSETS